VYATARVCASFLAAAPQEGSLAGMLSRVSGPLLHHYALPPFQPGPDLAWLCMAPTEAQAHRTKLLQDINTANTALFGQLLDPPSRPVLFQNTVSMPGNECMPTCQHAC
jgi:hypothetical protein